MPDSDGARRVVAERIALLLCVLRILPSEAKDQVAEDAGPNLILFWAEALEEVYQRLAPHKAAYEDGLISMCIEMCQLLGPVKLEFEDEQGKTYGMHVAKDSLFNLKQSYSLFNLKQYYVESRDYNLVSCRATLATYIYHNTGNNYEDTNGRHLFVTSVSRIFEMMRLRSSDDVPVMNSDEPIEPVAELLSCMVDTLRWSLDRSHPNCGAYISLPWVKDIAKCAAYSEWRSWMAENEALLSNLILILQLLQTCTDRGLISHPTVTAYDATTRSYVAIKAPIYRIDRLFENFGHPKLRDLPEDLTIDSFEGRTRRAELQTLDIVQPSDVHDPEPPGENSPEWPSSPAHAPSASSGVDTVAWARIDGVKPYANALGFARTLDADFAQRLPQMYEFPNSSDISSTPSSVGPIHDLLQWAARCRRYLAVISSPRLPHPELDTTIALTPLRRSLSSLSERPDDSNAQPGEPPTEPPLPHSTQSSAGPRDKPPFTYPPSAPSRLADSDVGYPSLERVRAADATPSSTMTDLHSASIRVAPTITVPASDDREESLPHLRDERAREAGNASAHTHEREDDTYSLYTLSSSRTLDKAAPEAERVLFLGAGVTPYDDTPHTHPEDPIERGHFIPLSTFVTPLADQDVPAQETRGGENTVTLPIDDTNRDLEAGPRIPSPVDEDRG